MINVFSLQDAEESLIVLSGCGTSGRIAFLLVVWSLIKHFQLNFFLKIQMSIQNHCIFTYLKFSPLCSVWLFKFFCIFFISYLVPQTSFNEMLNAQNQKQICSYIIAGGDRWINSLCLMHKMRLQCDNAVFQDSVFKGPCWHHRRLQRTTRCWELARWTRWTQEQRVKQVMRLYHSDKSVLPT